MHAVDDGLARLHDAHIDDLVVVASKNDTNNILTNVVDITFDGGEDNCSVVLNSLSSFSTGCYLLGFHEWCQVVDGLLHYSSRLDYLGQEHFTTSEVITHN